MNADGLLDRIFIETTSDKRAAERLTTEMLIALVGDWRARKDFYTEIASPHPDTAQLWEMMLPDVDEMLADLRANGYHDDANVDLSDPINAFLNAHPSAMDPLTAHFTNPLTGEECLAVGRVLWGDSYAN